MTASQRTDQGLNHTRPGMFTARSAGVWYWAGDSSGYHAFTWRVAVFEPANYWRKTL